MQKSKNKIKENINLNILKRLNYIYDTIISKEKTLEYSKKINRLMNQYIPKNMWEKIRLSLTHFL